MGYYHSGIALCMYEEIERIVVDILAHPEIYRTRKSIREQLRYLKELAAAMEHHQSRPVIIELRENLILYCKRNSDITIGPVFVYENLAVLRSMAEMPSDEQRE